MLSNNILDNEEKKENLDELVSLESVYGLNQQCSNSFGFLNEHQCIYLTGSNLLTLDINNFKQKLIRFKSKGKFQNMSLSSNKRYVLFVNFDQEESSLVLIDLKQDSFKKNIKCKRKLANSLIKSIAISTNMELIVCQFDSDLNWNLSVYSYMRLKKLAEINPISNLYSNEQTVEEVSFLPNEQKKFILIGHKLIKVFQYVNKDKIKIVCNIECMVYLERHSWFKNELVTYDKYSNFFIIDPKQGLIKPINFINKTGLSISLSNSDFNQSSQIYLSSLNNKIKLNPKIVCLNDGFILSNLNDNVLYYKFDCVNNFSLVYLIKLPKSSIKEFISNIYCNDSKTIVIAITNRNFIYIYRLKNLSKDRVTNEFELLVENYHYDSITCLDTCVRKPWIASCSLDRSLTIWNYETKSIDLKQYFDQELLSIAFHPSGLYLILCTTNSLKFMKICLDSLLVIHSLNVRNCTNCIFANGGHMFAFVQGTIVQIYSSVNFNELGSIKTQELGKIKKIRFTSNDNYLICCSMAGMIKIWNSFTLNLSNEIVTKGLSYVGLALHPDQEKIYLISTEKAIREYQLPFNEDFKFIYKLNTASKLIRKLDVDTDENLTCIEVSKSGKLLFAGSNKGTLKVFLLSTGQVKVYRAHSNSLNKICIAYNDELVVTGSDDGTIVFWQIFNDYKFKNVSNQFNLLSNKTQFSSLNLEQEIILANKTEYLEKSKKILEIQNKIDVLNNETDFELRFKELKFKLKTRDLHDKFHNQTDQIKFQIKSILLDQEKHDNEFNVSFQTIVAQHLNLIENLHSNLNGAIENEKKKNTDLNIKINDLEKEIEINRAKLEQIKSDTLIKQYEKVEIFLKILNKNHSKEMKQLENEINNLIDYEQKFEEELEVEKRKLNMSSSLKLNQVKTENENLNQFLIKLQNELKMQETYLVEAKKDAENKYKDYFEYTNKIKELEILENNMKQEFEMVQEKKLDFKEIKEFERAIYELNAQNRLEDKMIRSELKNRLEPIKEDNLQIKTCINEIKNEIKENKMNIIKIRNEIDSIKHIYRVKCDELNGLDKMTREKHLACQKSIEKIKKIYKEAHSKINL